MRHGVVPIRRTWSPRRVRPAGVDPSAPDEDGVAEHDRDGKYLLTKVRAVLHMEVQVRHQRVSRVPDRGDRLPDPHALFLAHPSASLLEVRQHGVASTADVEEDVVA